MTAKRMVVAALVILGLGYGLYYGRPYLEILLMGDQRVLMEDEGGYVDPERPRVLIIGVDGVGRDLLYEMLDAGKLPGLEALMGGRTSDGWNHAWLSSDVLSVMPSSTLPGWAAVFTGQPPARNGVTNNEFFIRDENRFAAPAPVSFSAMAPVAENFTDGKANDLLTTQTIYEQMREEEPGIRIWVAMSHFHRGANRLIVATEAIYTDAFERFAGALVDEDEDLIDVFHALDEEILEEILETTEDEPKLPHVLSIYLPGIDLYTHQANSAPDDARAEFLTQTLDPRLGQIHAQLRREGIADETIVVLVADHGHTEVDPDRCLLQPDVETGGPREVLSEAGFRVRPFEWEPDDADHQAVLAFGGAVAMVYLADRSRCSEPGEACEWSKPARYREDLLEAAEAFHRADADGTHGARMKGTLDLILVRREAAGRADLDGAFDVYLGDGRTTSIAQWASANPRSTYVAFEKRLNELAAGPSGDRAGDLLLVANFGNVDEPSERTCFCSRYHSWHGSPSRRDSEVPLIVSDPRRTAAQVEATARRHLGESPTLADVGRLLVALRRDASSADERGAERE